jgi:hypothetical protein
MKSPVGVLLYRILLFCSVGGETEPTKCAIVPLPVISDASRVGTELHDVSREGISGILWSITLTNIEPEFETS